MGAFFNTGNRVATMGKRPNHRTIRAARTYTIDEAANALAVSIGTVRNWIKAGLPIMKAQRPHLILGEHLKDFLQTRTKTKSSPLKPSELYCLSCRAAQEPWGMLVDCVVQTPTTARLVGLCSACGGTCNRMISRTKIPQFSEIFELRMNGEKTA